MNIAITGANGFIGSNLCKKLSEKHNILAISRNNDKLLDISNLSFLKCDLNSISKYIEEIEFFKPDILIHTAWIGGNKFDDINSLVQYESVYHSFELLNIFNHIGIKKFIGLGTGAEYGLHTAKVNENDICNPYNFYGMSKHYFRHLSKNFCEQNDISFSWVIPMYVYGQNDVNTRFVPSVIRKCLLGQDIILNSCKSYIDYLHIDDFINGIESIVNKNLHGIYNISSGNVYNTKNIVEIISQISNYSKEIVFDKNLDRKNFQDYFCGSSYKLQINSTWKPSIELKMGLQKTIDWQKKHLV